MEEREVLFTFHSPDKTTDSIYKFTSAQARYTLNRTGCYMACIGISQRYHKGKSNPPEPLSVRDLTLEVVTADLGALEDPAATFDSATEDSFALEELHGVCGSNDSRSAGTTSAQTAGIQKHKQQATEDTTVINHLFQFFVLARRG